MKVYVDVECTKGTAELHKSRESSGTILSPGLGAVRCVVLSAPELGDISAPELSLKEEAAEWIKQNFAHAWNSVGAGQDGWSSGTVKLTAVGHAIVVREYLEVNHFLEPDAADHCDHILQPGESLERDCVGSNAETLMAVRPA